MDPEDLQAELLALRRLYGLLIIKGHYVQDPSSENLDNNARQLLINLLDAAANKAFDAHAKILGTQSRASYSPRPIPQEQSRDRLNLQPHLTYAPTSFPSLQKVDLIAGQGIFSDPTNQVVFSAQSESIPRNESNVRLKRCRVCRKPDIKRFNREISIRDSKVLTLYNRSQYQNHKRSWEVLNEPSRVGDLASSSNSHFTVDFTNSLTLTNLTDQEDQISREASIKILQLESCISALQVATKHVGFFKNDSNGPSQTGKFSMDRSDPNSSITRTWKPRDMAHQWHEQTARAINMRPAIMMLPAGQTVSQQAEKVGLRNQHDHMPEEGYNLSHSVGVSSNLNTRVDDSRPLDSKMNRERLDRMQMLQWRIPPDGCTVESSDSNELQKSETARRKKAGKTCKNKDHINDYRRIRGKHELVDPKKVRSPKTQQLSDSPISSLNDSSSQSQSQSQSQSHQSSTSFSDNKSERELQSGSSRNWSHEESEKYSDHDQRPYMKSSKESSGSTSTKACHTKGHKKGKRKEPKRKSKSKMNSASSQNQSPSTSSSFESSMSMSRKTATKGHKKDKQKEPKRKSKSKMKSVSSQNQSPSMSSSFESSMSMSRKTATNGHKKGKQKEPKTKSKSKMKSVSSQNQSPSMSSSFESSMPISRKTATKGNKKGDQKEPMRNRVGRMRKLKDKLSVIFHHHHHHHHHHLHHHRGDDEANHKDSLWKHAKKVIGHQGRKKDEANAEKAVKKIQHKALVVSKAGDKNQKRHLQALVGGLLQKSHRPKTLKEKHGGGKMGKKMQWWQMLRRQRKIRRHDNLRGKIKLYSSNS